MPQGPGVRHRRTVDLGVGRHGGRVQVHGVVLWGFPTQTHAKVLLGVIFSEGDAVVVQNAVEAVMFDHADNVGQAPVLCHLEGANPTIVWVLGVEVARAGAASFPFWAWRGQGETPDAEICFAAPSPQVRVGPASKQNVHHIGVAPGAGDEEWSRQVSLTALSEPNRFGSWVGDKRLLNCLGVAFLTQDA